MAKKRRVNMYDRHKVALTNIVPDKRVKSYMDDIQMRRTAIETVLAMPDCEAVERVVGQRALMDIKLIESLLNGEKVLQDYSFQQFQNINDSINDAMSVGRIHAEFMRLSLDGMDSDSVG